MKTQDRYILIVDDVLKNLQLVAQTLKDAGYKFSLAQSGESALKLLENEVPDLILLDIMMPGMDGLEVCRIIKRNEKLREIPVIFITAVDQTDVLVEGFRAGGVDYITKPFNRDELLIRVKTHLDLSFAKKELLDTINTRDKLYSIIAHDIRSPFSHITMMIEALSTGLIVAGSEKYKEMMSLLTKSANETNTLFNNLLEWTKLQTGGISVVFKKSVVSTVIDDCIELLKGIAGQKNITIESTVDENLMAYFDEITMHTVFRNIISNAIKFTPPNGKISISAHHSDNIVSIFIKDNGVGMSEEVIDKIFNKNESYTSPGTMKEKGSGLGMHLVKDMVDQNHGTLKVESREGEGTTFVVSIPAVANNV